MTGLLRSPSHNLKYVGLDALAGITRVSPKYALEHQVGGWVCGSAQGPGACGAGQSMCRDVGRGMRNYPLCVCDAQSCGKGVLGPPNAHPRAPTHLAPQVAVIDCLEDPDDTLRLKTLELLATMTKANNVTVRHARGKTPRPQQQPALPCAARQLAYGGSHPHAPTSLDPLRPARCQVIVERLMLFLKECTDEHVRRNIATKVRGRCCVGAAARAQSMHTRTVGGSPAAGNAAAGSTSAGSAACAHAALASAPMCPHQICTLAERYAPDTRWFISSMAQVFELAGDTLPPGVAHNTMRLIAEQVGAAVA